MSTYIQYIGETIDYKVFVDVSNPYIKVGEFDYVRMCNGETLITPIDPSQYESLINHTPVCGRYEVTKISDTFIATEAGRDSYDFHLPGFNKIKELKIGEIIPLNGFKTEQYLSMLDKRIINKEITIKDVLRIKYIN